MWTYSTAISLCVFRKGVDEGPDGLKLISDVIREKLGITMTVLMGANLANEVADEKFCETTIGKYTEMEILTAAVYMRKI